MPTVFQSIPVIAGIILLVVAARVGGFAFHHARLPRVVGEIFGGLVLGPTVLGAAVPEMHRWLYLRAEGPRLLAVVSWVGLVALMFVSGFELRSLFSREDGRITGIMLLGATVLPFLAGLAAPLVFDLSRYAGPRGNTPALVMVVGIAVAVTSIPVISKIFIDLGILDTRFARLILAIAAVEDVALWVALAVATNLASDHGTSALRMVMTPLITVIFCTAALMGLPRVLAGLLASSAGPALRRRALPFALALGVVSAFMAQALRINVVFGAFLAGAALGTVGGVEIDRAKATLRRVSLAWFAPVYFAIVGLRLDLRHHFAVSFFLGFLALCTVVKSAATVLAGRFAVRDWLSTVNLAAALNARGGPGIVLATVAFDVHIIDERFFVALVLTAIVTSLMAGWWLRFVLARGWPLLHESVPSVRTVPSGFTVSGMALPSGGNASAL